MYRLLFLALVLPFTVLSVQGRQPFHDRTHPSRVLGEERHYRIFLPADYDLSASSYPVIYYFHGHSDRYTLERYDDGKDTVPKIIDFASKNPVIVVSVDGYVARDYSGFYGGTPWDVRKEGGNYDFGLYFRELVSYIDSTYRTYTDRRHRGTSGLSMGGFMSLYLSARFPDLIGSASSFNPGPEFFVGDPGRRVLWRPKDHVSSLRQTMVRLIRASGDYISQYHEETRDAFARDGAVQFEFRQDEYHRHWATSIGETFDFHMRAFANSALDNVPLVWSYANPYREFEVWGYKLRVQGEPAAITYLEEVSQGGLRLSTRRWAPDGPPVSELKIEISTAPLFQPGHTYILQDHRLAEGQTVREEIVANREGRLNFSVDGSGHQISLLGPGTGAQPPVVLPVTLKDRLRLPTRKEHRLPFRIYNPRGEQMNDIRVVLTSDYPTVEVVAGEAAIARLEAGEQVDISGKMRIRLTAGTGDFAPARLRVAITYDGWYQVEQDVDLLVIPEGMPQPPALEVLDGRTVTFDVFRQQGNQGGGSSIRREVTEGRGNGNGILEPGEDATFWVRLGQGLDPFDKGNWYRCKVYSDSPLIEEIGDIQESKQREWTSAQERTSLIRLSEEATSGSRIPLILANESWSFHYTPDVRYGSEPLYQAFQLHRRHLHEYVLNVP